MSSSWDPSSATIPSLMTMIFWAFMIVESLWAIMTTLTLRREARMTSTIPSTACWMCFSFSVSKALVASSKSNSLGLRKNARAMARRCFCPPLKRDPLSPNMDS
mmetsp:Transcript_14068/g.33088  ORF Transcript_14068/g.33088 Transcript_14068/m.33088 type:complete len:104 (+) Transcript_14068:642-953(+)